MHKFLRISFVVLLILFGIPGNAITMQTPEAFVCPVTLPSEVQPADTSNPFADEESTFYQDGIWVTIPDNGLLELTPNQEISVLPLEGWRSTTFTWLRDEGVVGWIIVSGERLDAESELSPQTPLSPQRQYVRSGYVKTGIAFPSAGCWEVTGTAGEHAITWVMDVRFVDEPNATPAQISDLAHSCDFCRT